MPTSFSHARGSSDFQPPPYFPPPFSQHQSSTSASVTGPASGAAAGDMFSHPSQHINDHYTSSLHCFQHSTQVLIFAQIFIIFIEYLPYLILLSSTFFVEFFWGKFWLRSSQERSVWSTRCCDSRQPRSSWISSPA